MEEERAARLLADLEAARDAAEALAGRPPLGVRAIEAGPGRRTYLCAFEGPAFLGLTGGLQAETDALRVRETAVAGLLWEVAEDVVDAEALRQLAATAGRLLALGAEGAMADALGVTAEAALALARWRESPERALASLPEIEAASRAHERAREAYTAFVIASDPLVAVQDTLATEQVEALRAMEEAAGRAGLSEPLAQQLGAAVAGCDEGAGEILAAHLTRLDPD